MNKVFVAELAIQGDNKQSEILHILSGCCDRTLSAEEI
jgi:hypothetical protein